jgi:hypothetical protein
MGTNSEKAGLMMKSMRQSGRINVVALIGGFIALVFVAALSISFIKESPGTVAGKFLTALAKGDVDTLSKLTYGGTMSKEEVKKEWEFTLSVSKHYRFRWAVLVESIADDKSASVRTQVARNLGPNSYDENYGIPLVQEAGAWKVDVKGISRSIFPNLPRLEADKSKS